MEAALESVVSVTPYSGCNGNSVVVLGTDWAVSHCESS